MSKLEIPLFVKNMGHKILAYILNISDPDALELTNANFNLDESRLKVINEFINICRQSRLQSMDQGDVDLPVMATLSKLIRAEKHLFNVWREQLGGELLSIEDEDRVVNLASGLALELYPLFLIKLPYSRNHFTYTYSAITLALSNLLLACFNSGGHSRLSSSIRGEKSTLYGYSDSRIKPSVLFSPAKLDGLAS